MLTIKDFPAVDTSFTVRCSISSNPKRETKESAMTYLETPEDLQWLRDVHLAGCTVPSFEVASIEGNEDWPDSITLYEVNHVNSLRLVLRPDTDGTFHCKQERY